MSPGGAREPGCTDCGSRTVRSQLGDEPLCDRCLDARISEETGWPRLPDPSPPETIVGSDGRRHRITYRVWRSPSGIVVEAEERPGEADGYAAQVVGAHDTAVDPLLTRAQTRIRGRIARLDLEPSPHGSHLIMRGDELRGRLVWKEAQDLYDVVVDGRQMSWEDLGRALEPFEGWEFRLSFDDDLDDELDPSGTDEPEGWDTIRSEVIH